MEIRSSRKIKQQDFRELLGDDLQRTLAHRDRAVTLRRTLSIHLDLATRNLNPTVPRLVHVAPDTLAGAEYRGKYADVLVHSDRSIAAIIRSNEPQLPAPFVFTKRLLLVTRFQTQRIRQNPDLQEM